MKIIVVDDNEKNRYLLEVMLRSAGYGVISAINGVDALEKLRSEPVSLIISDILMPKMDGYMLIRECKKDPALQNIPFIFYTASYTQEKDREFGLNLGADHYIIKPEEPDDFLEIIAKTILEVPPESKGGFSNKLRTGEKFLESYSSRIVHKLEQKVEELEESTSNLERSEAELRFLFDTMTDGVVFQDREGYIILANTAAENILGFSQDQMKQMTFRDDRWHAIHEDKSPLPGDLHPYVQVLLTGRETTGVMGIYNPVDDEYRWILVHSVPQFRKGEDKPFQVYSIIHDITERKKMEGKLQRSLIQITQNLEQMAIINDQIRNPLAVIIAVTNMVSGEDKEKILNAVDEINEIITRLDQGWLESEKVRQFLKSHYGF